GLMGRAAIGLLEKLEIQTQELSEHPKLKRLLAWVEAKTTHASSNYSGEIKRVLNLILILALASDLASDLASARVLASDLASDRVRDFVRDLDLDRDLARALASDLDRALGIDRARASALDLDRALALARDLARALASDLARALGIDRARASALDLDRALGIAHALDLAKFALDNKLIADIDIQTLISYLEKSFDSSTVSIEGFSSSLDISPELLDLSEDDVQAITNYLSTCQLMIDCSKQASGISAQQWDSIKQRMFLPKPAE
ncbi:NACHT C-terminal helical domain 2-containing protein, partial [Acaryochloris marina NIES-2412]|uniref:NACHT C-terminal helical domain 2-containing protein n=1 Tax=Acaryochloris marina TaxID=155978 RepID=UPI00405834B1